MTATPVPASTANVGTTVTVSGSATGCPNPRYEFWLLVPAGSWRQVQGYSTNATFTWNTSGAAPGSYRFSVWARDAGSTTSYDTFNAFDYTLTTAPCTGMSASASPPTSSPVGTTVTIIGTATGCPTPQYEFWILPPGGGWTLLRTYSASGSFTWNTAGLPAGSYRFSIWARDASSSGTNGTAPYTYDSFSPMTYTLT